MFRPTRVVQQIGVTDDVGWQNVLLLYLSVVQ